MMDADGNPGAAAPWTAPRAAAGGLVWAPYLGAVGLVAAVTGVAALAEWLLGVPDLEMLYLLAVLIAAVYLGRGPSLLAAALGVAAYDFVFVPPRYTFAVGDAGYTLTFAMMFGVGLVVSSLAGRLRQQEADARLREERTRTLYALAHELGAARTARDIAHVAARTAWEAFEAQAWVVTQAEGQDPAIASAYPPLRTELDETELGLARWVLQHARPAGRGTESLADVAALGVPLPVGTGAAAALLLRREDGVALDPERRTFLEAFGRQVALALSRAFLDERARQTDLRARTEEIRSDLLSAVSHDLRTPLASITGAATTLRGDPALSPAAREEMLATICEQSERLERLVSKLLDMTRLESGAVVLKRDWIPVDEVVGAALTRLEAALGARPVRVDIAEGLPLVWMDPLLLEQLLVNLLENAAKHTPAGTEIAVSAEVEGGQFVLAVSDRGAASRPVTRSGCSSASTGGRPPARRGVGWGSRSAARSRAPTAARCAPRTDPAAAPCSV